jgi:carbonic anhydrase
LVENNPQTSFRNSLVPDLFAGLSVALVTLPLALGISYASDVPPLAGVLTSIIAGLLATWIQGTSVGIGGTSNGMIIITASAMVTLADPDGGIFSAFPYVLAAYLVSGAILTALGAFKLGKLGHMMPSSVVYGLLAAIGILIITSQVDDFFGAPAMGKKVTEVFGNLGKTILQANPVIFVLGVFSLIFSFLYVKLPGKFPRFVPAPMWIVIIAFGISVILGFREGWEYRFIGTHHVDEGYLVNLPEKIWHFDVLVFPDFSKANTLAFWTVVLSSSLVLSIESLLSAKSVEKLDPYKRKTNLNKDLIMAGVSTMAASSIGALPVITVILRSSVGINQGARTRMTNFFHGLFLAGFVLLLHDYIQWVPLAALAGILIYSGYKLAQPKVFKDAYKKGLEQVFFLLATFVTTLATSNIILGLVVGVLITFTTQVLRSEIQIPMFLNYARKANVTMVQTGEAEYLVRVKGILNFANGADVMDKLDHLPRNTNITLDCSHARLVDSTILETLFDFGYKMFRNKGSLEIIGMDNHRVSTDHPFALHYLPPKKRTRLNKRQQELLAFSRENGWDFKPELDWFGSSLQAFDFFKTRPIEYKNNVISGSYQDCEVDWEIADITFDEGAGVSIEIFHTTIQLIKLPIHVPEFSLSREVLIDKVKGFANRASAIQIPNHNAFSKTYRIEGKNEEEILDFFSTDFMNFLLKYEVFHLESNGESLLIFDKARVSNTDHIKRMLNFSANLLEVLGYKKNAEG